MRSPVIRAVCFDLDGTLLRDDHADAVVRRVAAELAAIYPGVEADALADANKRVWWEYWPQVGEAWLRGDVPHDSVPREVWRRALVEVGVTDESVAARAAARHAALEQTSFTLYDEALEVLAALRRRGIRIALITNGPGDLQRTKLQVAGVADAFDAVIVSGERGVSKPEPEIFARALAELGVEASAALHVGDNLEADVGGARRAGLTAVWIRRGEPAGDGTEAHAIVDDLRDLLPLLDDGVRPVAAETPA